MKKKVKEIMNELPELFPDVGTNNGDQEKKIIPYIINILKTVIMPKMAKSCSINSNRNKIKVTNVVPKDNTKTASLDSQLYKLIKPYEGYFQKMVNLEVATNGDIGEFMRDTDVEIDTTISDLTPGSIREMLGNKHKSITDEEVIQIEGFVTEVYARTLLTGLDVRSYRPARDSGVSEWMYTLDLLPPNADEAARISAELRQSIKDNWDMKTIEEVLKQ